MNPEGFEYSALVPGRGIVVLELLQPGSFGMGGAFVDVKTFAGVVGNGVNDDSAGIQLALDTVAGSGVALWFSAGTYKTTSPLVLKSDTLVWGSPDARIECALATVGPQDALFLAPPPATVSTTTLANPPLLTTAGSNQFDTVASIAPGTTINVERAVNFDFEYITRAVSGVGPFTITLDRPMVRVFAAGDVVTRQAAGQVR